jgi:CheY-like chemotaxis protein
MGGKEAIKLIREKFGNERIKIVVITASTFDRRREHYLEMGCDEYISKPFKEEDIFRCLNDLLDVEFVYEVENVAGESDPMGGMNFSEVSIREDLCLKLKNSAELYNITELEKCIAEMDLTDGIPKEFVKCLRYFANKYDMEEIVKILETVSICND